MCLGDNESLKKGKITLIKTYLHFMPIIEIMMNISHKKWQNITYNHYKTGRRLHYNNKTKDNMKSFPQLKGPPLKKKKKINIKTLDFLSV